ncbi:putative mg2+ transporter zinc transport protein [Diaporthe ampelina]|uniref:Putative mg2+ transporter zinc transport protein n=1 Tax=Diaporthe ampelina TaxID=1214573 RepID=A0A0G2HX34_9PEZI|nr:putative mg2+ transporter zinc transport protein [Diaporthe ampelina]
MDLFASLTSPRTAQQAKKRFLWLPHANAETALLCWAASPEQERAAISLFFDRHSKYEKYVWDDTTMVLNTWKTELHLSFYVLVDTSTPRHVGLPPPTADLLPGELRREIRRASMSFRFDGDFFDRYWTCHFVEHVPNKLHQVEWSLPFDASGKNVDKQWWQRKVLELFLLNDILCEVDDGAMEVLSQVRKELGVEESSLSFSILDSEAYSSSKDNWHRFEQILHAVEEDLTSILNTLQKWTSRERDRGQEKPRWTRSDERKYRGAINKYRGATERQIRDLGMHRDTIRKLKDTLATSRQKIRDDRELHRNENIRYFTYVTVIFLPLGFAASFYSMNGAPENDLLSSLIKFAAGAFAVTVALLASAKTLFLAVDVLVGPLRRMRSKAGLAIEKYSRSTREESWLMMHRVKPGESDEQGKGSPPPPPSRAKASGQEHIAHDDVNHRSLSPILFWPAYIFIEIPARRVLVAIFELKSGSLSPQAIAHIIAGVVLVPVFGLSWLVKVIFVNIQDVVEFLKHIGDLIPKWSTSSKPRNKDDDAAAFLRRFEQMTNTPEASRPLKMLQERMNRKLKTSTTAQED